MNTVKRLFRHRLIAEWAYQYSVWKTVVDWIVALYIVIPFSALFLYTYWGWWKQVPAGLNYVPLNAFIVIVLLFSWLGTIRIFVESADQIFLFQRKAWMKGLVKYSLVYYLGFNFLMACLFCFVLAPFLLLHYEFTLNSLLWFVISTFLFKASIGMLKQYIQLRFQGWKRGLITAVMLAISGVCLQLNVSLLINQPTLFFLSFLILFIIFVLLIYRRISLDGTLLEDISLGQTAKMQFTNVLLRYAGTYTKKPITFRTRPFLFRDSNIIFKRRTSENALVELCLKSTLRHSANIKFYLQVIVVYALFLSIFPPIWKWAMWGVAIVFLTAVVKLYWLESVNSPYVTLFRLKTETKLAAASRSLFILALPGEALLALFVVLQTQQWLYALIILPIGFWLGKFAAKQFAMFS
ncbi:ABC transporter permease [Desulfitobacterium sp.]|uniref:ABC transporter permease n=1 Tax=Desulfitobacterium sp. TaxID=49981 RepID=UPI002B21D03F|nr:ABC transporter permease [Desulfitobacterium sp.]MEA4900119.1 ABC transporter permease [Desulfitobacterium sp.]